LVGKEGKTNFSYKESCGTKNGIQRRVEGRGREKKNEQSRKDIIARRGR